MLAEIVKDWLAKHHYDGLYHDECGCLVSDLMPCGEPSPNCRAGYNIAPCNCGEEHEFHITAVHVRLAHGKEVQRGDAAHED